MKSTSIDNETNPIDIFSLPSDKKDKLRKDNVRLNVELIKRVVIKEVKEKAKHFLEEYKDVYKGRKILKPTTINHHASVAESESTFKPLEPLRLRSESKNFKAKNSSSNLLNHQQSKVWNQSNTSLNPITNSIVSIPTTDIQPSKPNSPRRSLTRNKTDFSFKHDYNLSLTKDRTLSDIKEGVVNESSKDIAQVNPDRSTNVNTRKLLHRGSSRFTVTPASEEKTERKRIVPPKLQHRSSTVQTLNLKAEEVQKTISNNDEYSQF